MIKLFENHDKNSSAELVLRSFGGGKKDDGIINLVKNIITKENGDKNN